MLYANDVDISSNLARCKYKTNNFFRKHNGPKMGFMRSIFQVLKYCLYWSAIIYIGNMICVILDVQPTSPWMSGNGFHIEQVNTDGN